MKLAPLSRALAERADVQHEVVHTGQHFDPGMSADFFRDLSLREPDYNLGVGSGSHAQQTARVIERLEPVLCERRPDVVLVYGDVNSTAAAALVVAKLGIPLGHVEAGLRSRDRTMPEEINRLVTDRLADWLFAPSRDAVENLRSEGEPSEDIHFVGNVMIDTLAAALPAARTLAVPRTLGVSGGYVLATLHRPSNVDDPVVLAALLAALERVAERWPVLFPVHPRTQRALRELSGGHHNGAITLLEPMGYLQMVGLLAAARLVVTDSGGVQEETSYLGVPCITVRNVTERPVTCVEGTNQLCAPRTDDLFVAARRALESEPRRPRPIERWDGKAAERITAVLLDGARFA
jgi:UDP-N-acetylglucosamine 2-epimerase (non-hydrolysing)